MRRPGTPRTGLLRWVDGGFGPTTKTSFEGRTGNSSRFDEATGDLKKKNKKKKKPARDIGVFKYVIVLLLL